LINVSLMLLRSRGLFREISLMTSIEKIFLGINNITSLPSEIGLLSSSLKVLNLMSCTVNGSLFSELGELSNLKKLDVSENYFEGPIPSELGRLKLETLYLNHNMFAGTLPVELFHLSTAKGFNVAANALSGTVPTEVGRLSSIEWLNLYGNWVRQRSNAHWQCCTRIDRRRC
jgi:Leucine-rich repeat (LRR) protein